MSIQGPTLFQQMDNIAQYIPGVSTAFGATDLTIKVAEAVAKTFQGTIRGGNPSSPSVSLLRNALS